MPPRVARLVATLAAHTRCAPRSRSRVGAAFLLLHRNHVYALRPSLAPWPERIARAFCMPGITGPSVPGNLRPPATTSVRGVRKGVVMRSTLPTQLAGAAISTTTALSGAPWGAVLVLMAMAAVLPVVLKEWRTWRVDAHSRTVDQWAEHRRRQREAQQREILHLIKQETSRLEDPAARVDTYLRLLPCMDRQSADVDPPDPGEGAGNSP